MSPAPILAAVVLSALFHIPALAQCGKTFLVTGRGKSVALHSTYHQVDYTPQELQLGLDSSGNITKETPELHWGKYYGPHYSYFGPPTKKQDCGGMVLQYLWGSPSDKAEPGKAEATNRACKIPATFFEGNRFYDVILKNFGQKIGPTKSMGIWSWGPVKTGDVLYYPGGHVAVVVKDTPDIIVRTKNGNEPVFEFNLKETLHPDPSEGGLHPPPGPLRPQIFQREKNAKYDMLVQNFQRPDIYRVDLSAVKVEQSLEGVNCDPDLEQMLKNLETEAQDLTSLKALDNAKDVYDRIKRKIAPYTTKIGQWTTLADAANFTCESGCPKLAAVKPQLEALAKTATEQTRLVADKLDQAVKLAESCASRDDAKRIRQLQGESIKAIGAAGVAEKEAKALAQPISSTKLKLALYPQLMSDADSFVADVRQLAQDLKPDLEELNRFRSEVTHSATFDEFKKRLEAFDKLVKRFYPEAPPPFDARLTKLKSRAAGSLEKEIAWQREQREAMANPLKDIELKDLEDVLKKMRANCCSVDDIDKPIAEIDDATKGAMVQTILAADLPSQADKCEIRVICNAAVLTIREAIAGGRLFEAEKLLKDTESAGCDVQAVKGELAAAWMAAKPVEYSAQQAYNNLLSVCDYAAALAKARALQGKITDYPWPTQHIVTLEAGARAQAEINRLAGEVARAEQANDFAKAREIIRQMTALASPYPCLKAQMERLENNYGAVWGQNEVNRLRGLARDLQMKKLAADRAADSTRSATGAAIASLTRLTQIDAEAADIAAQCRLAENLQASIQKSAAGLQFEQNEVRQKLDDLAARTKVCNAADAAAAKQSYQAAIRQLGNIGATAKEMRRTNDVDLRDLLNQISRRTAAFQPDTLLAQANTECDKARVAATSASDAARAGAAIAAQLKAGAAAWPGGPDAQKLTAASVELPRARELFNSIIAELGVLTSTANSTDLASPLTMAQNQVTRCEQARTAATQQAAAAAKIASCKATGAEASVAQADQIVSDLGVEVAFAAGLSKTADDCLGRLNAPPATSLPPGLSPSPTPPAATTATSTPTPPPIAPPSTSLPPSLAGAATPPASPQPQNSSGGGWRTATASETAQSSPPPPPQAPPSQPQPASQAAPVTPAAPPKPSVWSKLGQAAGQAVTQAMKNPRGQTTPPPPQQPQPTTQPSGGSTRPSSGSPPPATGSGPSGPTGSCGLGGGRWPAALAVLLQRGGQSVRRELIRTGVESANAHYTRTMNNEDLSVGISINAQGEAIAFGFFRRVAGLNDESFQARCVDGNSSNQPVKHEMQDGWAAMGVAPTTFIQFLWEY